jgi:hypothetical protein
MRRGNFIEIRPSPETERDYIIISLTKHKCVIQENHHGAISLSGLGDDHRLGDGLGTHKMKPLVKTIIPYSEIVAMADQLLADRRDVLS